MNAIPTVLGSVAAIATSRRRIPCKHTLAHFMDHPDLILSELARPDQLTEAAQVEVAALLEGVAEFPKRFSPAELTEFCAAYYRQLHRLNTKSLSASEWAAAHGRSKRQALTLLSSKRVVGAWQDSGEWRIPEGTNWPELKVAGVKPGKRALHMESGDEHGVPPAIRPPRGG